MPGGPAPKDPALRQRTNKKSTKATLVADPDAEVPILPLERNWNTHTQEEWIDIWRSPMASQYGQTEYHGLLKLMILVDDFWTSEDKKEQRELMVEIRLQRSDYGITPIARARLHWEVDRGEQAAERSNKRHNKDQSKPREPEVDPRAAYGIQGGLKVLDGGKTG